MWPGRFHQHLLCAWRYFSASKGNTQTNAHILPKLRPWFYGQWDSSLSPPTLNFSPWFCHQWDHSSRPPTLHFHTAVQSWELHLRVSHVRCYSGCLPSISHRCSLFLLPTPFSSPHLSLSVLSEARNCRHLAASLRGLASCSPGTFPIVRRVSLPGHKPSLVSAKPQLARHPMLYLMWPQIPSLTISKYKTIYRNLFNA